jgi:Tol biopolymer transport system component/DNA-binding winged helix-turn-helix (wHTH) protein
LATYESIRRTHARFDCFQVDLSLNALFRSGVRLPIQEKPLQVLRLLLEAEGKVVTREQLCAALWPGDTFVDFEHGLNTAVKKLRQALEDSAEEPRFIETHPRMGYRFLVPVEWVPDGSGNHGAPRVVAIAPPRAVAVPLPGIKDHPKTSMFWRFAPLIAALFLASVAGAYLKRRSILSPPEKLAVVPFTTFPGFEIAPSFSPDGNQIVFSWFGYEKEYQFDLYVKQVGNEQVVQLTHHPATFLAGDWSPNGRYIAFMRQADPDATGIYVVSPLGGAEKKLASITPSGSWEPIGVSWSSDSKWVAFSKARSESSPPHFSIHLVNVENNEERVLPDPSDHCANTWLPAFSPDGKYLASVCVLTEGFAKIYVQTTDGKEAADVTEATSSEGFAGIDWAADSQSLLYSSDHHLWRVPLRGGRPERLLFAQDVESVSVARHGDRLAFAQVQHPGSIWRLNLVSQSKIAGPASKLVSSTRGDMGAHISPDNRHIAFLSRRSGSLEVWVCDRNTANPVQLTSFGGPQIGEPRWSPDSRQVVFDVRTSGNPELYLVNLDGGPPRRFLTGTANAAWPFWSADGNWIYFNTERPHAIWKAPVGGGVATRLTEDGMDRFAPQEAQDRSRVYFYASGRIWSVSTNGGDEQPAKEVPANVMWAPAPSGSYFINGGPRHFSLNYLQPDSGNVSEMAEFPNLFALWALSVSPDGGTILFSGIEHSEGDIMLVEGFR